MVQKLKRAFWIALFILASGASHGGDVSWAQDFSRNEFEKFITEEMIRTEVEGLSVAVIKNGSIAWAESYGFANSKAQRPVTKDTVFRAASIGKVSAAYAAMILIENGQLSLEMPLRDQRIEIPENCPEPTIGQALSHTTGMTNAFRLSTFTASCEPGSVFKYSGQGYAALATMIGRATEKPAHEAIADLVFTPLHMGKTRYGEQETDDKASGYISAFALSVGKAMMSIARLVRTTPLPLVVIIAAGLPIVFIILLIIAARKMGARGSLLALSALVTTLVGLIYVNGHSSVEFTLTANPEYIADGLTSTAEDLALLSAEILTPTLVSMESRDAMLAQQVQVSNCIGWSRGLGVDACGEKITYWQWGSNPGFEGLIVIEPEGKNGIVILTNTGGSLDALIPGRGGYVASKNIARRILGINGAWDLKGKN